MSIYKRPVLTPKGRALLVRSVQSKPETSGSKTQACYRRFLPTPRTKQTASRCHASRRNGHAKMALKRRAAADQNALTNMRSTAESTQIIAMACRLMDSPNAQGVRSICW